MSPKHIPEFDVEDVDTSLRFHLHILGFQMLCDRPGERFAFFDLNGA